MMIFLKLLLSSGLMFIAETAFSRNESSLCYEPSKYIKSIHYDVKLFLYIEGNIFYGESNISISILNKTQNIFLHSGKLCIENMVLFTNLVKIHENDENIVYKPTSNKINEDTIHVSFVDKLLPGNYILSIKYYGIIDEFFRTFEKKGTFALVGGIHFHVIGTRQLALIFLSCWDQHKLLEATFNMSIGCSQCTVLSNMPLRNMEKDEYNTWTHFDTTPAILSPYLATTIVFNYLLRIDDNNQNIEMWCRKESKFYLKFANNFAEKVTSLFKNEWKQRSNNISKVTHVAIPNFHDNSIIVFGIVFYNETDVIYDRNLYPIAQKIKVALLVGRKVTQEWFNNMLNDPLVSDFWFKNGLIPLLAMYAVSEIYENHRIINLYIVQNQHYSFNLDSYYYMLKSTSQANSSLEIPNSIRAPFILRMLQPFITEEIFQRFVNSHRLSFADFMANFTSKKNLHMPPYITGISNWENSEQHCPLIEVVRYYNESVSQMKINIKYIDILKNRNIPLTFTTEASPDFDNLTHYFLPVSGYLITLPFKENGWMIFNIQQVGYYRVNYDDENWRRISNYLNSDNYTKIHVLNRAQIIDDAFHLIIAGQLQSHTFWDIIKYLHREEDYIAWYPMFKALEYMYGTFPWREPEGYINSKVSNALCEVLKRIKYEEIDDTDELRICLRQEAARWACFFGDFICTKEANNKLKQHLQNPTKHKILKWWKKWTYCKGLMINTDKTTWKSVYTIGFIESENNKFIEYLACTEDTDQIKYFLRYKTTFKQESQYLLNSFLHIITKHAKNQDILQYIINEFFNLKPKYIGTPAAFLIIINNIYSEILAEHIYVYLISLIGNEDLYVRMKKKKSIIQNYDTIRNKISIRKHQIKRQRQYFESLFV